MESTQQKSRPSNRRSGQRPERAKPEFEQKILDIRRVTRVVRGGRRFSFSLVVAIGDRRGQIGLGVGKGSDIAAAMGKAYREAKKEMFRLPLTKNSSLPHEVEAKSCGSRVIIRPAKGRGLVAGSSVRTILALGGVRDVSAKINSKSKNKLNNARVTIKALRQLQSVI